MNQLGQDEEKGYYENANAYQSVTSQARTYGAIEQQPEKVLAGVVGAFLFSLIGAGLYFAVYQLGFIAGICGLVIFMLASFGYQLFSGKKNSMKGVVVSIIMLVVMIFIAEYFCIAFDLFNAYKNELDITFWDAANAIPEFFGEAEFRADVIKDLAVAYLLGAVGAFSNIRFAIKANRAAKEAL